MDKKFQIGNRIRKLRKAMGLTQEQFAEKIDIDYKYLSKIENGLHLPTYKTLLKISSVLNVKFDDFDESYSPKNDINPIYIKSLKILNSASNDQERKYYLDVLKLAQKGITAFR